MDNLDNRIETFEKFAKEAGFNLISKKSDSIASTCLLFRKRFANLDPLKQIIVPVKFGHFDEWVDKLKNAFTQFKNRPKNENIWMIADDNCRNGILGLTNCLRQEPGGDRFRCIYSFEKLSQPVDFTKAPFAEILQKDLAINVIKNNQHGTYRLLDLERNYNCIETEEAFFDIAKKGDLTSLKWFTQPKMKNVNTTEQVNVKIHYSGLDRKDLLLSSGQLGVEFIERSLGTDFAGNRADNGQAVMGLAHSQAIASTIDIDPRLLVPIPNSWTLEDGASSINSLFTVWYSLINQAHLESGN